MKRLARIVFALCTAASLLVCVAACVFWARSYRRSDGASVTTAAGASYVASTAPGRLELKCLTPLPADLRPARAWAGAWSTAYDEYMISGYPFEIAWVPPAHGALGFGWESRPGRPGLGVTRATVPFWFIALAALAPPALAAARAARRRRRARAGRCRACGYDLRASPDRCPECGAAGGNTISDAIRP